MSQQSAEDGDRRGLGCRISVEDAEEGPPSCPPHPAGIQGHGPSPTPPGLQAGWGAGGQGEQVALLSRQPPRAPCQGGSPEPLSLRGMPPPAVATAGLTPAPAASLPSVRSGGGCGLAALRSLSLQLRLQGPGWGRARARLAAWEGRVQRDIFPSCPGW